jgi:hypothetical protein
MRMVILVVLASVGLVLLAVFAYRLVTSRDLRSGVDPRIDAAAKANPNLEIGFVLNSFHLYRVRDRARELTGYIQLQEDEQLSGPLEVWLCDANLDRHLPEWVPRFPKATQWVCTIAGTDQGERRHASFVTSAAEMAEAYAFYAKALDDAPYFTNGAASATGSPMRQGVQSWSNIDTGRKLSIRYYSEGPADRPFVSLSFIAGKDG